MNKNLVKKMNEIKNRGKGTFCEWILYWNDIYIAADRLFYIRSLPCDNDENAIFRKNSIMSDILPDFPLQESLTFSYWRFWLSITERKNVDINLYKPLQNYNFYFWRTMLHDSILKKNIVYIINSENDNQKMSFILFSHYAKLFNIKENDIDYFKPARKDIFLILNQIKLKEILNDEIVQTRFLPPILDKNDILFKLFKRGGDMYEKAFQDWNTHIN